MAGEFSFEVMADVATSTQGNVRNGHAVRVPRWVVVGIGYLLAGVAGGGGVTLYQSSGKPEPLSDRVLRLETILPKVEASVERIERKLDLALR